jgi:hypothetical protein
LMVSHEVGLVVSETRRRLLSSTRTRLVPGDACSV